MMMGGEKTETGWADLVALRVLAAEDDDEKLPEEEVVLHSPPSCTDAGTEVFSKGSRSGDGADPLEEEGRTSSKSLSSELRLEAQTFEDLKNPSAMIRFLITSRLYFIVGPGICLAILA